MVTKLLLTCLVGCMMSRTLCEQPTSIVVENHNIITPSAVHSGDCSLLSGTALVECMCCLDPEQLVQTFMRMNWRAALYYYCALNNGQKVEFLTHISDEQWASWHAQLPACAQKQLQADRLKEKKMITDRMVTSVHLGYKTALILATVIEWIITSAFR